MKLLRWNYTLKKYDVVDLPEGNYKFYSSDMNEVINCPHCGKELKFGDAYTSYEFQSQVFSFGYGVCEECYKKEVEEKRLHEHKETDKQ